MEANIRFIVILQLELILSEAAVKRFLSTSSGQAVSSHLQKLNSRRAFALMCVVAIGQEHVLRVLPPAGALGEALEYLSSNLAHVEEFYR